MIQNICCKNKTKVKHVSISLKRTKKERQKPRKINVKEKTPPHLKKTKPKIPLKNVGFDRVQNFWSLSLECVSSSITSSNFYCSF